MTMRPTIQHILPPPGQLPRRCFRKTDRPALYRVMDTDLHCMDSMTRFKHL
jgi:hypothetical protein